MRTSPVRTTSQYMPIHAFRCWAIHRRISGSEAPPCKSYVGVTQRPIGPRTRSRARPNCKLGALQRRFPSGEIGVGNDEEIGAKPLGLDRITHVSAQAFEPSVEQQRDRRVVEKRTVATTFQLDAALGAELDGGIRIRREVQSFVLLAAVRLAFASVAAQNDERFGAVSRDAGLGNEDA